MRADITFRKVNFEGRAVSRDSCCGGCGRRMWTVEWILSDVCSFFIYIVMFCLLCRR